jgi:hypothetical protein
MKTNNNDKSLRTKWGNRFIIAAIVQGGIMTGMALVTVAFQLSTADVDIIQFLSLSFEGPAKMVLYWNHPLHDIDCCYSSNSSIL